MSRVSNNEALAREGIDTGINFLSAESMFMCNNEALAREGIDTSTILLDIWTIVLVTMRH